MEWVVELEVLLKDWAEKSRYYAWMHNKSSSFFQKRNNMITIPLIIISTLSGSANFTMVGISEPYSTMNNIIFPLTMGVLSIATAILSAMSKYLKTAELAENHRTFYKKYNVLFRNISLELSLPTNQRKPPGEICNAYRYEFDGLVSESPTIPDCIISEFNTTFPFARNKPEIAHSFEKVVIFGRERALRSNQTKLIKIRNFYRLMYNVNQLRKERAYSGDIDGDVFCDPEIGYCDNL
jgi:hypothetical protein